MTDDQEKKGRRMTRLCDLPDDLVGEKILAQVPITSIKAVRSTCKLWNALSKKYLLTRSQHEFVRFTTVDDKVCSLRFHLDSDLVPPSINQVALLPRLSVMCYQLKAQGVEPIFGQRLSLPFNSYVDDTVTLSCVREEQLAVLYEKWDPSLVLEISVTDKIEPDDISWSKFLVVDMAPLTGFAFEMEYGCFFIEEEKKVAVVFDLDGVVRRYQTAYIIGEDGYFKSVSSRRHYGC